MAKEHVNILDSYMIYKRGNTTKSFVDRKVFMKIQSDYMKFLFNKLIDKGEIVLPERLGRVQILGKKCKAKIHEDGTLRGLAPDWVSTKELWDSDPEAKAKKQLVYFFNEETGGIRYKFFWNRNRVLLTNKSLYEIKMCRANKRYLAKIIKDGREYLIKEDNKTITYG